MPALTLPDVPDGVEHWDLVPLVQSLVTYVKALEERVDKLEAR